MDARNRILSISEIQRNLRELYRSGLIGTSVIVDGVYDEVTANAVREYQTLYGLPSTGVVDYVTWTELYERAKESRERRAPSLPIYPFERILADSAVSPGDVSETVYIIQLMLKELAAYGFSEIAINGVYDEPTRDAILSFQRVNLLDESGVVDKETWNALASAYNKYIKGVY